MTYDLTARYFKNSMTTSVTTPYKAPLLALMMARSTKTGK